MPLRSATAYGEACHSAAQARARKLPSSFHSPPVQGSACGQNRLWNNSAAALVFAPWGKFLLVLQDAEPNQLSPCFTPIGSLCAMPHPCAVRRAPPEPTAVAERPPRELNLSGCRHMILQR